jgi:hypothetical protein
MNDEMDVAGSDAGGSPDVMAHASRNEDVGTQNVGGQDVGAQDVGTEDVGTEDVGTEDVGAEDVGAEDVLVLEEIVESLELPVWEPTGEPRVDEALDELTRLDPDDVHQHAAVFDGIHQLLRGTLSDLDTSA